MTECQSEEEGQPNTPDQKPVFSGGGGGVGLLLEEEELLPWGEGPFPEPLASLEEWAVPEPDGFRVEEDFPGVVEPAAPEEVPLADEEVVGLAEVEDFVPFPAEEDDFFPVPPAEVEEPCGDVEPEDPW